MASSAATRPRGPYAKTKTRREAIALAVLELVVERGHRALTSSDVAERCGLSEPGVLYHYSTKEALLVAALQLFEDRELAHLSERGAYVEAGDRAALGVHRENIVRLYTSMAGESADPAHPAHEFFRRRWETANRIMRTELERMKDDGRVRSDLDATRAARQIHALWEGLQQQWLVDPSFDIRVELVAGMDALTGRK